METSGWLQTAAAGRTPSSCDFLVTRASLKCRATAHLAARNLPLSERRAHRKKLRLNGWRDNGNSASEACRTQSVLRFGHAGAWRSASPGHRYVRRRGWIGAMEHVGPEPHAAQRAERRGLRQAQPERAGGTKERGVNRCPMKVVLSWHPSQAQPQRLGDGKSVSKARRTWSVFITLRSAFSARPWNTVRSG